MLSKMLIFFYAQTFIINGPSTCKSRSDGQKPQNVGKTIIFLKLATVASTWVPSFSTGGNSRPVPVTRSSGCLRDRFSVSTPGSAPPPELCGANDGEHSSPLFFRFRLLNRTVKICNFQSVRGGLRGLRRPPPPLLPAGPGLHRRQGMGHKGAYQHKNN